MTTGDLVLSALRSKGSVKEHRSGQYRTNSPFRADSDSMAFTLMISPDGEHGAYRDIPADEFGSLYTLAEKLGIEVPRLPATETKRSYKDMDDYALAHGVTVDVLTAAGWYETSAVDMNGKERPAIGIPTQNGTRFRFLDGDKPTYHSPGGYKNCWYGLKKAIIRATESKQPIVLCNGSASVVTAQHFGVASLALAGGGQRIPQDLLDELNTAWQGAIIIAMDCDTEGQKATKAYHEQLPKAHIVDLALSDKGDLADFCSLFTEQSVKELSARMVKFEEFEEAQDATVLAAALRDLTAARKAADRHNPQIDELLDKTQHELDLLRHKAQPATMVSFSEIVVVNRATLADRRRNPSPVRGFKTHLGKLDHIVGGWQGGRVHIIYGDTNMGKSTLACSLGVRWIAQAPGLILPTESPPSAYIDKLAACQARLPYDLIETGQMTDDEYERIESAYKFLEDPNCNILDKGSPTPALLEAAVREGIEKYGYKWLIVDSMSKMKVAGTNDIYETTRLSADCLQDLARDYNLMVLATVQVGRNLKDRAIKMPLPNDALGAGTVEQNADVIMSLYNHNHYVKLGVSNPDPKFPDGSSLVTIIKHRWKDAIGKGTMLKFVGGSGFYEMETHQTEPQWRTG